MSGFVELLTPNFTPLSDYVEMPQRTIHVTLADRYCTELLKYNSSNIVLHNIR